MRILLVGFGKLGVEVGQLAAADGHAVFGLRRSEAAPISGVTALRGDVTVPASLSLPPNLDAVIYAIAAGERSDEAYRAAYAAGLGHVVDALRASQEAPEATRLLFVSSTGVYGQTDGSVVDEASPAEPAGFTGRRMLQAEAALAGWPGPTTALRLGGIYGPSRTHLVESVRIGRATYDAGFDQWTNRVHQSDAARAALHVLGLAAPPPLLNVVDREPAPRRDVLRWLAEALGAPPPREADVDRAAPSFTNKRVSSARLLATGFEFRYPTFREGYAALVTRT